MSLLLSLGVLAAALAAAVFLHLHSGATPR